MEGEVSRSTLTVLLILAIVVSIIGTWTVLDLAGEWTVPSGEGSTEGYGEVSVTITGAPVIQESKQNGEVSITII